MTEHPSAAENQDPHVTHTSNPRVFGHREASTDSPFWYTIACGAVLLIAAALRVRGLDVSLFEDEVWVAELVRRGGWGPHTYLTPPLFYAVERAWAAVRGASVVDLRIMPAVFGVVLAAVPLFATSRDRLTRVVWSLLLAASSPLVFYSTRIKQYTLEATVACILVVLFLHARERRSDGAWIGFFAVAAAGVATLYEPVFLLAGCALLCIRRPRLDVAFGLIFLLFGAAYFGWLSPGPESTRVHGEMTAFFNAAGRWVTSPRLFITGSVHWVGEAFNLVRWWWIAVALLVVGWLIARRDWVVLTLAIVPPLLIAAASAVHIYPYGEVRLMIVCFPALYLAVADAVASAARRMPFALLLLVPYALSTTAYNDTYMRVFDLRPLYDNVAANHRPGERIFAIASLEAPLRFHHPELARDIVRWPGGAAAEGGWYLALTPLAGDPSLHVANAWAARVTSPSVAGSAPPPGSR
jgi:hypothetical protein